MPSDGRGNRHPCEELWRKLADAEHPLLALIEYGDMSPTDLTYIAEYTGRLVCNIRDSLLDLLKHENPVVREGAIIGLTPFFDEGIREALRDLAALDPSEGVRNAAKDVLS